MMTLEEIETLDPPTLVVELRLSTSEYAAIVNALERTGKLSDAMIVTNLSRRVKPVYSTSAAQEVR